MRQILTLFIAGSLAITAQAQHYADPVADATATELGLRLLDDHHFYASSTLLSAFDPQDLPHPSVCLATLGDDREPARLMTDYHLLRPATAERIARWTRAHPVHPLTTRLDVMRANLLVRDHRYSEALRIYGENDVEPLPADERCDAVLHQAVACIHTRQLQRAEQLLQSIEYEPTHGVDVQYYLGYVYYAQGRHTEALPPLSAAAASYDYRRTAPVCIADCQVQLGHYDEAIATLQQWRQQTHATTLASEADRIEGEARYGLRQYSQAIPPLQHYVQSAATPARSALYKLGMSQLYTQQYAPAALHLSSSAGTARDVMSQNAWLNAGIAYIQSGHKQQASMAFQQASETDFDPRAQEEALYNYALTLHDGQSMGFGESVTVFERFLNTFPNSRYRQSVSQHLTEVYLSTHNYQAALASINRIRHPDRAMLDTKQQVLCHLGAQKYAEGNFTQARNYLQQSLQIRPTDDAYYWKGETEYRLGNYRQAETDLRHGQESRYSSYATYALGYALFKQKKYAEALPQFQRYTQGTTDTSLRADALCRMADCQFVARQYDNAYNTYQQAIDTDRSHADYALLQQAFIQGLKGNYTRKVELLSQIDGSNTTSDYAPDALYEKGRAYVQSGQKALAQQTFSTLQARYPQSQQARKATNELAMLLHESGHTEEAVSAYRSVIENHPHTAEAQTALANLKDIYTRQGRVQEYAALAQQAGHALSPREIDQMTADAALRAYSEGNHAQAIEFYKQLEAQTQNTEVRRTAQLGLLRSAHALQDHNLTIKTATRLLDSPRASAELAGEARLLRAQAYMATGDAKQAVADYQTLSRDQHTVYGAQAVVMLAQYAYDTQQYQSAEQVLTPFIDSGTSHSYWLARAFVLLSDVYAKTGRTLEARQYLLSLRSNYTESEEINSMIQQRLNQLK